MAMTKEHTQMRGADHKSIDWWAKEPFTSYAQLTDKKLITILTLIAPIMSAADDKFAQLTDKKLITILTLIAPIISAADDKFCDIFPDF